MAGERIGKTYEALFKVALDLYCVETLPEKRVFWNETPDGITVQPDFSIGITKDRPEIVFLVTHIGASSAAQKKCWRNIGELCEIKTILRPCPLAVNVVFDSDFKEDWKVLQKAAFDGQYIIGDKAYGREITQWVNEYNDYVPDKQEERAEWIKSLSSNDVHLYKLINCISKGIGECIRDVSSSMHSLWSKERDREKGSAPQTKLTYFRRGMCKLLLFDDVDLAIRLYQGRRVQIKEIPEYIFMAGLAKPGIGHVVPVDNEISNSIQFATEDEIKKIYHSADNIESIQLQIKTIRNTENIIKITQYIIDEYDDLCDEKIMLCRIKELHDNPMALISEHGNQIWPPDDVWLVTFLIHLFRAVSKSDTGYGISQLGTDVINSGYGNPSDLSSASQFGGGFGFTAWVKRKKTSFKDELVGGVAVVLAKKLSLIPKETIVKISKTITESIVNNLLKNRICNNKEFKPLQLLLEYAGIIDSVENVEKIRSCFAESCGLRGLSGITEVYHVKNTIINWQSSYEGHPADKKKELSGRAVGLRYSWNNEIGEFVKRPGVERLILVLDGTWKQQHLEALIHAGWDEIYYPDEMDKLKEAIV